MLTNAQMALKMIPGCTKFVNRVAERQALSGNEVNVQSTACLSGTYIECKKMKGNYMHTRHMNFHRYLAVTGCLNKGLRLSRCLHLFIPVTIVAGMDSSMHSESYMRCQSTLCRRRSRPSVFVDVIAPSSPYRICRYSAVLLVVTLAVLICVFYAPFLN